MRKGVEEELSKIIKQNHELFMILFIMVAKQTICSIMNI